MENRANLALAFMECLGEHDRGCAIKENNPLLNSWPAEYQQVTEKIAELKLENEQLRKMYADLMLRHGQHIKP